jgi:hypothetical protein
MSEIVRDDGDVRAGAQPSRSTVFAAGAEDDIIASRGIIEEVTENV